MDYLYGGLTPEHPTVVAGLFIPDMPQDWTPYASTLQLLLNFRPWMEVVVFSTDVQVKSAVVKLGAHCLDEYPLVRHYACGGQRNDTAAWYSRVPWATTLVCAGVVVGGGIPQGHGLYPLVGGLLSALKAHEADALFYGLIDPTALLHSDVVSSLHSIANEQTAGTLPPQAFVVGRTVVPEEHINQAAVAQAVRGDPRLLHVAIHDLAMHGQLRPAEEMDYFFVSRSAWDWDQAPPIMSVGSWCRRARSPACIWRVRLSEFDAFRCVCVRFLAVCRGLCVTAAQVWHPRCRALPARRRHCQPIRGCGCDRHRRVHVAATAACCGQQRGGGSQCEGVGRPPSALRVDNAGAMGDARDRSDGIVCCHRR